MPTATGQLFRYVPSVVETTVERGERDRAAPASALEEK
jgi:hypothetical protein